MTDEVRTGQILAALGRIEQEQASMGARFELIEAAQFVADERTHGSFVAVQASLDRLNQRIDRIEAKLERIADHTDEVKEGILVLEFIAANRGVVSATQTAQIVRLTRRLEAVERRLEMGDEP